MKKKLVPVETEQSRTSRGALDGALAYLGADDRALAKAGKALEADADVARRLHAALAFAARTTLDLVAIIETRELSADERGFVAFARPAAERWQELAARKDG